MSPRALIAVTLAAGSIALGACSTTPPAPEPATLQFESEPPGADIRTSDGQTCRTPCELALPLSPLAVTFALKGYQSQTLNVAAQQPPDYPLTPVHFAPNPVAVTLVAEAKPPPKPKPVRRPVPRAATPPPAAGEPPPQPMGPPAISAPRDTAFPPPPPTPPPAATPFPPPPSLPPVPSR